MWEWYLRDKGDKWRWKEKKERREGKKERERGGEKKEGVEEDFEYGNGT